MNSGINLLAEKKKINSPFLKQLPVMRFFAVALLFGVSAASIILFILVALSPIPELQQQEQAAITALSNAHPEMAKLAVVNERTNTITKILATRSSYDKTLGAIKTKMPSTVSLTAFTIEKNTVNITVSSKSLLSIDSFINNVMIASGDKKEFSQVTLKKLSQDNLTNQFSATLSILL